VLGEPSVTGHQDFLTCNPAASLGMPMITMGDEVRRPPHGNNNAYCQKRDICSIGRWVAKHAYVHRLCELRLGAGLLP